MDNLFDNTMASGYMAKWPICDNVATNENEDVKS